MSNDLDALVTKLRALRVEWDDDVTRMPYEKYATSLDASQRACLLQLVFDDDPAYMAAAVDAVIHPQGIVNVSEDARINGVAVGVNLGRIVYGRDPEEDERRQLVWYLARLANRLARLPLRGMAARLDDGQGVALPKVYMMAAINGLAEIGHSGSQSVLHYFQQNGLQKILKPE